MKNNKLSLKISINEIIKNYGYAAKLMFKIYPSKFIFQIIFWILTNILNFFSHTYMLRYVINSVQSGKNISYIIMYMLFVLVTGIIIDSIRAVYDNVFLPIIDRKCSSRLNIEIYRRSLEIDISNYENPQAYEMYERAVSNGTTAIESVIGSIGGATVTLMSICMEAWIIFEIDPILFIFAVIPWIFIPLQVQLEKKQYEYNIETQRINRRKDYTRRTFFQVEFAKEIRLTNMHRVMLRYFEESIKDQIQLLKTKGLRIAILSNIYTTLKALLSVRFAQIYAIYQSLVSGTIMYGDCLVAMKTVDSISQTAFEITYIFSDIYEIALNIRDYKYLMEKEAKVSSNHTGLIPKSGDIEFKDVSFRYEGGNSNVLNHINLQIRNGEHIAIVGYNGAGKTTLIKLLMRLYDPNYGEICVAKNDIRKYRLNEYRRTYGVVFQDYKQMALTVAENVLGRPYHISDEEVVWSALEKAELVNDISGLKNGIHTIVTKEFDENGLILSGGQSQKLAIASIYARNVDTVILDEPSAALDPIAEKRMYKTIFSACEGKTVIFISHRLSSCVDADNIIFMENGSVVEVGNHKELIALNGKYAEMFRMQAENYTD